MKLNKKQKRTATIASMAALLAVVLGMGGQTFAKYIETHEAVTQTAVVAKWGYVIQASAKNNNTVADTAFGSNYDNVVVSSTAIKVVAPGTSGSLTFSLTGVSEVDALFTLAAEGTFKNPSIEFEDAAGATATYAPVVWKVNGEVVAFEDLEDKINGTNKRYEAHQNITTAETYTISWEWAFSKSGDSAYVKTLVDGSNPAVYYTYDDLDTMLGRCSTKVTDETTTSGTITVDGVDCEYECGIAFGASASITQVQ